MIIPFLPVSIPSLPIWGHWRSSYTAISTCACPFLVPSKNMHGLLPGGEPAGQDDAEVVSPHLPKNDGVVGCQSQKSLIICIFLLFFYLYCFILPGRRGRSLKFLILECKPNEATITSSQRRLRLRLLLKICLVGGLGGVFSLAHVYTTPLAIVRWRFIYLVSPSLVASVSHSMILHDRNISPWYTDTLAAQDSGLRLLPERRSRQATEKDPAGPFLYTWYS